MTDQATPAKVRLTDVLGPWAPAPARTQWGEGMVEALVGIGRDETARIYADKAAAPLVAEAIFADYVRGRLAALRDHYAAQGRPASEDALLFAALADCEMAILGPNAEFSGARAAGDDNQGRRQASAATPG